MQPKFTLRAQKVYQAWLRKTEEHQLAAEKCVDGVTVCRRGQYIIDYICYYIKRKVIPLQARCGPEGG